MITERRKFIDASDMKEQVKIKYKIAPLQGTTVFDDMTDMHHAANVVLKQQKKEYDQGEVKNKEIQEQLLLKTDRLDKAKVGNSQLEKAFDI